MNFRRVVFIYTVVFILISSISNEVHAKKRGGRGAFAGGAISAGLGIAITTADQSGMDSLISAAKTATNSSASTMGSATEYIGYLTFRFSNDFVALQIRPSLFSQSSSGSGTDGAHSYKLSGLSVFPLFRIIPLSNDLIDFYMQAGLGYGKIDGSIQNGATNVNFSGSGFGTQMGLGAEFCFIPDHCFNVEGNYRYLPISRNIVTSGSGLPAGVSQATADRELEDANGMDVPTTLSGVSGMLSYTYNF